MGKRKKKSSNNSAANLGFEDKLWLAAEKLQGHMDAAEGKHVALGLPTGAFCRCSASK